ncbi:hypothetical protein ZEAMMB73_Zm00001d035560 [Zea mays]|uniref:Uncharacterized protein n=1 Tax=Zea mays TaxID=4577 RepID=A0A1D6LH90_MAIZE|nr:hypothetical protein ZEAMMB73_Zm00001d035560 [Zea mays]
MAENPAPSSPLVTSPDAAAPPLPAEFTKLTFRSLYIRRTGPGSREMTVDGRPSDQLGRRFVSDFPIYGGLGGNLRTIDLGDAEVVREVSGTYGMFEGATTLTSIRILTSSRTWGPWGIEDGTRFCITAPIGSSIVGFYGRSTSRLVAAIGVYLRQQL